MREHYDLVFISQAGMVQRTGVRGISKQGRPAQGVRLMNLRDDDVVSAVALVMETNTSAQVQEEIADAGDGAAPSAMAAADAPDAGGPDGAEADGDE